MKIISALIVMLMLVPYLVLGSTIKNVHISFSEDDFQIEANDGIVNISTKKYVSAFGGDKNAPALPLIGIKVLIEADDSLFGFSSKSCERLILDDVLMAFNPKSVTTDGRYQSSPVGKRIYTKALYPDSNIEYGNTHLMDGYKFISFVVCPFKYNSNEKKLYLITEMDINITLEKTKSIVSQSKPGRVMRETVRESVINGDEMDLLYDLSQKEYSMSFPKARNLNNPSLVDYNYEYIIITNEQLAPEFQRLADWKTTKGIRTKVLTVEEIDDNYTGSSQQLRIKTALKDYKDNNENFKYALLGGDIDVVPAQMSYICFLFLDTFYGNNYDTTPADLFYACFDTMDWDSNSNGVYGEFEDNVDMDPEIYVSRIPVSTPSQAQGIVNRIVSYECRANAETWEKKMLMAGSKMFRYYNLNGNNVSDAQYKSEWLFDDYISSHWDGDSINKLYDTDSSFGGSNYDCTSEHLQDCLEEGYIFVDVYSHGNPDSLALENSFYDSTDAIELGNSGYSIITTVACKTSAFDLRNTCLAEGFMKNPNSGILGYLGSSRSGISYDTIAYKGPSCEYIGAFYNHLFTDSEYGMGKALAKVKSDYSFVSGWYIFPYRWLNISTNLLGDPEMPVFFDSPQHFNPVIFNHMGNCLYITPNNQGVNPKLCATDEATIGNNYFEVSWGNGTFCSVEEDIQVCITSREYKPLIFHYANVEQILNNHLVTDNQYVVDEMIIGSQNAPNSSVILEKGTKTYIDANITEIYGDFEVKEGAELYIY